jgi:hypothetical protein
VTHGQPEGRGSRFARLVSGGQSGADRAALDFAISHDIPYGGWCPKDGWAEDHPTPPGLLIRYPGLTPTASSDPSERTRRNVIDSDATLVVVNADATSVGTDLTRRTARAAGRPLLVVDTRDQGCAARFEMFLRELTSPVVLNVAGPRESESPGIYDATLGLLAETVGVH